MTEAHVLITCPGLHSTARRQLGFEPATYRSQIQHPTAMLLSHTPLWWVRINIYIRIFVFICCYAVPNSVYHRERNKLYSQRIVPSSKDELTEYRNLWRCCQPPMLIYPQPAYRQEDSAGRVRSDDGGHCACVRFADDTAFEACWSVLCLRSRPQNNALRSRRLLLCETVKHSVYKIVLYCAIYISLNVCLCCLGDKPAKNLALAVPKCSLEKQASLTEVKSNWK